jgi:NitT/TauT family transport system substrate-binding protein
MVPALQRDRVDAAVLTEPFLASALAEGMRAIAWPFGETKPGVEISAWVTTDQFIEENPETVEKFQQAIDEANEFSQANPDAVREAILSYTEIPAPVVENMTLPRWSATLDVESVSLIGELANEFGELDEIPSTDDVVQPEA